MIVNDIATDISIKETFESKGLVNTLLKLSVILLPHTLTVYHCPKRFYYYTNRFSLLTA